PTQAKNRCTAATVLRQNISRKPTTAAMAEARGIMTSGPMYSASGSRRKCSCIIRPWCEGGSAAGRRALLLVRAHHEQLAGERLERHRKIHPYYERQHGQVEPQRRLHVHRHELGIRTPDLEAERLQEVIQTGVGEYLQVRVVVEIRGGAEPEVRLHEHQQAVQ